ncbi:PREDICTED: uncharacterized protein LOC105557415 isoform X2 [Vollenhovia emeryi]|uniref:uncharacterized protein LOC105557415 isoform X2 n=1 Tax=Vollenhovia emeryi TaxID=411798 RepID=UPI0005F3C80A|nr:PREDICTED: uncharacterized protein LOC105557415 isoform X2 [Vollenhovia emeryi]
MQRKVMIEEVFSVVKLSLFPCWSWPLPKDATKFQLLSVKLYYCLCIIVEISLIPPLIYGIKNNLDDPTTLVQQVLVMSSLLHTISNFIFYMINYHRIQNVTFEMIHFTSFMKPHEEVLIQRYIDKCVVYHAKYPFDVFYQPLKTVIYINQSMAGILVSGQLCTNIYMALLLWFASARIEILSTEFERVTNIYEMYKCIKKHQELLEYSTEVARVARPFVFASVCCSITSIIASFLLFITKQPTVILIQYFGLSAACISEVFMYNWPGEHLMFTCHDIGQVVFSNILENSHLTNFIDIWKCLQIIIMRSQKPVKISIPCFIPALSLNYFTSYLSTIFSYFTTLRVMMNDNN